MRILFHSNAPWAPTGYGNQTALFVPRLDQHHDVAVSSFYGLEGKAISWHGIPVLPGSGGTFGNESLPGHANAYFDGDPRAGLVLTLMDVWVLDPEVFAKHNTVSWCPVDHDPVQASVRRYFERSGAVPLAMSRFGADQLEDYDPIYVPHGVDTKVFEPTESEMREAMGVPEDAFLVGMVAANKGRPSRKCFSQVLQAFAALQRKHDDSYLYLHTVIDGSWSEGEDIPSIIAALGIPLERVKLPDQYRMMFAPFDDASMAALYSTFDVLVNPAMGEGFGIPMLEAQACGTPVIATDFSAMPEVVGAGILVSGERFWTPAKSWQALPDVREIAEAMESFYLMPQAKRDAVAIQARQHAEGYDADRVLAEHLLPALEEVQARIGERPELKAAA